MTKENIMKSRKKSVNTDKISMSGRSADCNFLRKIFQNLFPFYNEFHGKYFGIFTPVHLSHTGIYVNFIYLPDRFWDAEHESLSFICHK